jgi:hypothetical protein
MTALLTVAKLWAVGLKTEEDYHVGDGEKENEEDKDKSAEEKEKAKKEREEARKKQWEEDNKRNAGYRKVG